MLDFVSAETAWAYAATVAMATDYAGLVMGPLAVSFVGVGGETLTADLWATNELDDPDIGGIVCMLTEATTALGLGEAIAGVAASEPFDTVAGRTAVALQHHPVVADAAVFVADGGELRAIHPTAVPESLLATTPDAPWVDVRAHRGASR
ncbi:MAG: hypothetical protein U5R31_04090 [Acidimicrobiia bacterium]|nr:hypothetical protein [Acidimicrobiia bacterium]